MLWRSHPREWSVAQSNLYLYDFGGRYARRAHTPQAASAIGYSEGMVLDHIEKKHLEAVKISGKYIIAKPWLVDFLAGDTAFEIVNKSNWHINTILKFKKKN